MPSASQLDQIITTKVLGVFGDPEIQRRDLRLFVCLKDLELLEEDEYRDANTGSSRVNKTL